MNTAENGGRWPEIGAAHPEAVRIRRHLGDGADDGLCVLDGYWALEKAADAGMKIQSFLFCPELMETEQAAALFRRYTALTGNVFSVSKKTFARLTDRDDPVGLTALAEFPVWTPEDLAGARLIAVLDGLETPGNIGTILRTCDGAGADGVAVVNKKAGIRSQKVIKASMGAAFTVPAVEFASVGECRRWLAGHGFTVYLADTRARRDYDRETYRFPAAVVAGCERYGISREWYDGTERLIKIPMRGVSDSLNVGVAASVFLYEMSGQRYAADGN
ncbi:MAG: hypothetical protein IJL69_01865 [Oscillospiraceae bacterium]|nr:hypothetical protein [Oscillospiraceae bacterium]